MGWNQRLTAPLLALVVLAGGFAALPAAIGSPGTILAGFAPGSPPPAALAAAGDVVAAHSALGVAVVRVADAPAALALLAGAPGVDFAEQDGVVAAASARWDSARWDSGRWDSSRWDAALPDSSRWDSSRWDSSRWDSSRWDSSRWDGAPLRPDPLARYQWGLADMNVPDAWTISMGSMRRALCVLDSGVDAAHPDLAPQMWTGPGGAHGWDFVDGDADPTDDAGHGTHVACVAAAAIGNGVGAAGVANARIMAVKVLGADGVGREGDLALGIAWCADHGANVISMSLSTDQDSKAVHRAVEHAIAKGALLVASAGNAERCADCPVYPAGYEGVLGVAALTMERAPASFSRAGKWVDLAAPGELIAGPYPGGDYVLGTGTSQAAALVAGAALLAWDEDPSLSAQQVARLLQDSARDLGAKGKDPATGWGEPDVFALLRDKKLS